MNNDPTLLKLLQIRDTEAVIARQKFEAAQEIYRELYKEVLRTEDAYEVVYDKIHSKD